MNSTRQTLSAIRRRSTRVRPSPFITQCQNPVKIQSIHLNRPYSSTHYETTKDKTQGYKISYIFGGLAVLGLFVTSYGLLEWYYAFDTWPPEVREHLKKAIRNRNRGDLIASEAAFTKSIEVAQGLPLLSLGSDPLLKITGLYITLAAMHESAGQPRKAFRTLQTGLELLQSYADPTIPHPEVYSLTPKDETRSIALCQKMGSLAYMISEPGPGLQFARGGGVSEWDQLAEVYLTKALEGMIKLGSGGKQGQTPMVVGRDFVFPDEIEAQQAKSGEKGDREINGESIARVTRKTMGLTMENLADLYARRGVFDRANPLYVQAISSLLPPDSPDRPRPSVADRCQAATLMNTLSSALLNPPSSKNITASKAWSLRSLQLSDNALSENAPGSAKSICERARIVAEFNMGALLEMEKDIPEARRYLSQSQVHSKAAGFKEGVREAGEALSRLRQ